MKLKFIPLCLLIAFPCLSQTTGGAGNANRVNFPGDFSRAGVVSLAHLYITQGFADSSQTIDLITGVYENITNEGDSLYSTGINRGFIVRGDSVQCPVSGDYRITWCLSGKNVQAQDEIHIAIFVNNVEAAGKGEAHNESGAETDNIGGMTILNITAGHWVVMRIKIATAGDRDFVAEAGNLTIGGLYAN